MYWLGTIFRDLFEALFWANFAAFWGQVLHNWKKIEHETVFGHHALFEGFFEVLGRFWEAFLGVSGALFDTFFGLFGANFGAYLWGQVLHNWQKIKHETVSGYHSLIDLNLLTFYIAYQNFLNEIQGGIAGGIVDQNWVDQFITWILK